MTLDLVVLGLLIIVNILNHSPYVAQRWYVPTGIVGSVLIVWIGYRFGRIDGTRDAEQRIARTRPSQRAHLTAIPKEN